MSGLVVTLPLLFACQLIGSQNYNYKNVTIVKDTVMVHYTSELPDGYVAYPNIGVAYKFHKRYISWNTARKLCISEGARLAIVDSYQKIEQIMGIKPNKDGVHTGIHRMFDDAEWTNVGTGQPVGFIPWKSDAKLDPGTGQCVAMWFDGSGNGPWNCSQALPTVCEIPI